MTPGDSLRSLDAHLRATQPLPLHSPPISLARGALAPVIASYNSGEERVSVWLKSAFDLREDFFIDTIPYRETRRFVREVTANVAGYHRVSGDTKLQDDWPSGLRDYRRPSASCAVSKSDSSARTAAVLRPFQHVFLRVIVNGRHSTLHASLNHGVASLNQQRERVW